MCKMSENITCITVVTSKQERNYNSGELEIVFGEHGCPHCGLDSKKRTYPQNLNARTGRANTTCPRTIHWWGHRHTVLTTM